MEGVLCKSSAGVQNEPINLSVDTEVFFGSEAVQTSSKHVALVKDENLEAQEETNTINGHIKNDSKTVIDGDSPNVSESASLKSFSPKIIGSAIQAMKNLFSPDKTKSKSVSVLNPVNQQRSTGSPHKYVSSKAEASSSAPTIEILNKVKFTSEERKNLFQIPEVGGTQSSMALDDQNNLDETFFTTVSLIDDSFHSTVADLDEHEALKNGTCFIGNVLNNSQNIELLDIYNDTMESNESYLENTTLKIGSFTNEENNMCNMSILNTNGSGESIHNLLNKNDFHDSGRSQDKLIEKSMPNSQVESEEFRSSKEWRDLPLPTPSEMTICLEKMNGDVADIFLNKSFEESIFPASINDMDVNSISSTKEQDVQTSISTTTIVLNSNNSDMLSSLKSGELDSYNQYYNCIEENDYVTDSVANAMRKPNLNEIHCRLPYKQSADSCSYPATSFSPSAKEKKCASEGNSPTHALNLNKVKLNKSDELINRRIPCEPLEGKWSAQEKNSSVDITLMKNIEASEMTRESSPSCKVSQDFKEHHSEIGEDESSVRPNAVAVISQQSYTILTHDNRLNRPVIEPVSTNVGPSEKQTFQMIQSVETLSTEVETSFGKNCKNTSFSTNDIIKSPEPKQSTPLWEGNNQNGQKNFRPTVLKLHSPDNKKHPCDCDSIEMRKNISIHSHPVEISPVDPINDFMFPFESQTEGCDNSAGFEPKSSKVLSGSGESNKGFDMKKRAKISRRSEEKSPLSFKVNQTLDKKQTGKNQESLRPNQTFRRKSLSPEGSRKGSLSPVKQSDAMVNKDSPSQKSKNWALTYTKKRESGETEKINQTFDLSASPKASQKNKTYEKSFGCNQQNETYDKKSDFENKTQIIDSGVEFPARNQTLAKESCLESCQGMKMQELNLTFDKNEVEEIQEALQTNDSNGSVEGNKTFRNSSCLQPYLKESETFSPSDSCNIIYDKSNKTSEESTSIKCDSFRSAKSSTSDVSTATLNDKEFVGNQSIDNLSEKLEKMDLAGISLANGVTENSDFPDCITVDSHNLQTEEKLLNSLKEDKLRCDPDLVQLIQEQFSPNDIEKICNVVQDLSSLKLSNDILQASEQFDRSLHGNLSASEFKPPEIVLALGKVVNPLSPQSLDFLNSIEGKPTGRDLSRESLYVKFDPLVQPAANSLIDFTKEGEALTAVDASPPSPHSTSICEQLLTISPQKKPDDIVPPLTPLSHKVKSDLNEDKFERLKELQNEIYFLKNLYAEREKTNKTRVDDYESQIAKLTGQSCFLTDKLKESNEREKSLVKKMKEQTQGISQLKVIMEEYVKVISKLGAELEAVKGEYKKQVETLTQEKDSYMTHLQNTEAAFTDVHAKYEKSKKTIVSLKGNETVYRNTIAEQAQKLEDFKVRTKEAQEKAVMEFEKIQEQLGETKAGHAQETARLRAQLRKAELKVEALQESLDQKIKENQQLTAICDELIEGKK